ncbi:POTRA domain-containing protein [Tunturibacter empetritectus]|uniref:Outer membrane protein insertion porin family n=1 Tax=Tunturiibacter empetritectus TaxID=3069691 RepID=A0A7W8MQA5_9BACT|nr:POTRA domain-containing protein [Edaphobacter lichenicola]MBB5316333.1 outer membrane protein insertion porin family [Edaphobacter lichenicola]
MRSTTFRPALLALCLSVPTLQLPAQSFLLPPITFTGAPAFSQAELLKVSGLQPGATATQADVQSAAQHLSDTGLFTDIRFESNATGLVYDLKPMPPENLLPATFTNFVWWSPAELTSALKARVPLYTGVVPTAGNLQDSISSALKAMVAEKGVTANVVAIAHSDQPGATPSSIAFAIESPAVRVHSLTLVHASPSMQEKLDKVIKEQTGQPFTSDITRPAITTALTSAYHNEGYLDMAVLNLTQAPPQVTPTGVDLDFTATLKEGQPYQLFELTWPGSDIISTADFNKQVKMKAGDMASEAALRQSLAIIAGAYFAKGFEDAKVKAPATFDHISHRVSYNITVDPGPQYHIHSIKALGLSTEQQKQFDSAWHMNPGDFYDTTYLTGFLHNNSAIQSLAGYSATYNAIADPNTHLVDLTITFAKGGVLN